MCARRGSGDNSRTATPYTRWRSMSRTPCLIRNGLRGSAMYRLPASSTQSLQSSPSHSITPPSDGNVAAVNATFHTWRPSWPNSTLLVPISSVQFGTCIHLLKRASDTNDNAPSGRTADLYRENIRPRLRLDTLHRQRPTGRRSPTSDGTVVMVSHTPDPLQLCSERHRFGIFP